MKKNLLSTVLLFLALAVVTFAFAAACPQGSISDEAQEKYSNDTSSVDDDYAFLFDE